MLKFLITSVLIILPSIAAAEDLEIINRPVNSSGFTGLLFTTAPYTVPDHTVEVASAVLSENSTVPDYIVTEVPMLSITAGVSPDLEIAIKGSYFRKTLDGGSNKERGAGDTHISCKWNFLPHKEYSSNPSLALLITGIAPTADEKLGLSSIVHWGAKTGLSVGTEMDWGEHIVGIYADGQVVFHDLSDKRYRDRYGEVNAGLLLPISKHRNLQMLIEYNLVSGIDKISALGGDYSGLTYGLRLVGERFNLSFGTQFLHKKEPGFEKANRVIGMASIKL